MTYPWIWLEDNDHTWEGVPSPKPTHQGIHVTPFPIPPARIWEGIRIPPFWRPVKLPLSPTSVKPLTGRILRMFPPHDRFEQWVTQALQALDRGELQKVVVARAVAYELSRSMNVEEVWTLLKQAPRLPHEARFFLALDPQTFFFGISPEILFSIHNASLHVDLLAGTATHPRHLEHAHIQREHAWVERGVREVLRSLVTDVSVSPLKPVPAGSLWHLHASYQGRLREGVSWRDVLKHLHPTPALGGYPKEKALEWIRKTEGGLRGWYGGTIGWFTPKETRIWVAIRSALLRGRHLYVFAGGGVVPGHTPEELWEETSQKMQRMVSLFISG